MSCGGIHHGRRAINKHFVTFPRSWVNAKFTPEYTSGAMPTPQELRQNAWKKLQCADALIASGCFDEASYLAGYAVEMSLKARYCTREGMSHFPDDADEAKALNLKPNKIFIHDLEKLLTLSQGQSIKQSSLLSINWEKAKDWSEKVRYLPPDSVSKEKATEQILESRKLVVELAMFEIVEKMVLLETSLSTEYGPFSLFVVADKLNQKQGWEVYMSAWWLDSQAKLDDIGKRGIAAMDSDLAETICYWGWGHPSIDIVQRYNTMINGIAHAARCLTSGNIVIDRILPPTYVITSCRIPQPLGG